MRGNNIIFITRYQGFLLSVACDTSCSSLSAGGDCLVSPLYSALLVHFHSQMLGGVTKKSLRLRAMSLLLSMKAEYLHKLPGLQHGNLASAPQLTNTNLLTHV